MTRYNISYQHPSRQFFTVEASFKGEFKQKRLEVHLPSWRPGRYELQHFSKRIKKLTAFSAKGKKLNSQKTDLSSWIINTEGASAINIVFEYYAGLMDAGNSWLDDEQLYINFINCLPYVADLRDEPCEVNLELPSQYKVATGLEKLDEHKLYAPNYNILVDSPIIASAELRQLSYKVDDKLYTLWFKGKMNQLDTDLQHDFIRFTKKTIEIMGALPCEAYHFLYQILPYKHYHGVEHWNSTVITIGPEEALGERSRYLDFLGVSCHELFHTWNVIRLRPKEMIPYHFQLPNLHLTGFITEGVTTYYGDLILVRSAVYSLEEYIAEVNQLLKKHFENEGRFNYSLAESSLDLWIDGYEKGIPGRKVSIYNEGALAAMILDLTIRKKFNNRKSLDDVMRLMWTRHGEDMSGYSWQDYKLAAEDVFESDLTAYFEQIIFGTADYGKWIFPLFNAFGIQQYDKAPDQHLEKDFGIKTEDEIVIALASGSAAEDALMLKDKIIKSTDTETSCVLQIERYGQNKSIKLEKNGATYFSIPQVREENIDRSNPLLKGWLEI